MIDLTVERPVGFNQATLPDGSRPSYATWWRWSTKGVRGGVRLETVLIGGRRFTTEEAVERFIRATSAVTSSETPPPPTPRQRAAAVRRAKQELAAAGI